MATARNLRELLTLRYHNRAYLDSIRDNLGSALGLKNGHGDPCVIVFVPRKINAKWLQGTQQIRNRLEAPGGLYCPLDVVEGTKYSPFSDVNLLDVSGADYIGAALVVTRQDLLGSPPLSSPARLRLLETLKGWSATVMPGAQLYHPRGHYGTLGCYAIDPLGKLGFITNKHVAGEVGDHLTFPEEKGVVLGHVKRVVDLIADEVRFPGIVDEPESHYNVDSAFVELLPNLSLDDIEPRLPLIDDQDELTLTNLGSPLPLDLDTLGPLGTSVVSVGCTRSFQKGHIAAFAYTYSVDRWNDVIEKQYTDFLIVGKNEEEFSNKGDSGKLIVIDDDARRPVALLWGGAYQKVRTGRAQEKWTYAIDINKVLDLLGVSIIGSRDQLGLA